MRVDGRGRPVDRRPGWLAATKGQHLRQWLGRLLVGREDRDLGDERPSDQLTVGEAAACPEAAVTGGPPGSSRRRMPRARRPPVVLRRRGRRSCDRRCTPPTGEPTRPALSPIVCNSTQTTSRSPGGARRRRFGGCRSRRLARYRRRLARRRTQRKLDRIISQAGAEPSDAAGATSGGDDRRLRGLPAIRAWRQGRDLRHHAWRLVRPESIKTVVEFTPLGEPFALARRAPVAGRPQLERERSLDQPVHCQADQHPECDAAREDCK